MAPRRKQLLFLIIFLLGLFLLMTGQVRSGLSGHPLFSLFTPLMAGLDFVTDGIVDTFDDYVFLVDTEAENRRLRATLQRLELEQSSRYEVDDENKRLRTLLNLVDTLPCQVKAAEVIARDPTDPFQTLTLNKGAADGLGLDMAVIGTAGLIGRIFALSDTAAKVMLITDLKSSVAVRIAESREQCIMDGAGDGTCSLKYVHKDAPVQPGNWVYTSGLDGIFPEGVPVGRLESVRQLEHGIFQEVSLLPAERMPRVEEVLVIVSGSSCARGFSGG